MLVAFLYLREERTIFSMVESQEIRSPVSWRKHPEDYQASKLSCPNRAMYDNMVLPISKLRGNLTISSGWGFRAA